jgi:hypothetical protein
MSCSPVTGSFATVASGYLACPRPVGPTCHPAKLDASVGASGPHDFAVRSNISRQRAVDRSQVFRPALRSHRAQNAAASTASRPYVRDDGQRPSVWDGMRKVPEVIWGLRKPKYFCKEDWTAQIRLICFNKLQCPRGSPQGENDGRSARHGQVAPCTVSRRCKLTISAKTST